MDPPKQTELSEEITPALLLQFKESIDHELQQLKDAQITVNQESQAGSIEEVSNRIKVLQKELLRQSTLCSWSELRFKRMELGEHLLDRLFTESDDSHEEFVKNNTEKLEMASSVLRIKKEIQELQEKVVEQNSENMNLVAENTELLKKLKSNKDKHHVAPEVLTNKDYKRLKAMLEVKSQSIIIYKNIIQRLVIGLGIDLNTNEELREAVEKSCDPFKP